MTRRRFEQPLTPGTLPGRRQEGITERLCEGTILAVSEIGATFSLPEFPAQKFGPAPWCPYLRTEVETCTVPHSHAIQPHVGDRCLVGFAGPDRNPWVIGWWPA